jgi:ssDNA-binding Zn-finger/Zn-ribbon topoisomerase 1
MAKRNIKRRRKIINRIGRDCPVCGRPLVKRPNKTSQEKFIGCSNYPKCRYIQPKTIVDYACESLCVDWRPNINREVISIFDDVVDQKLGAKGSRAEIEYMLGAAYYLDHLYHSYDKQNGIELYKTEVQHNSRKYAGVGFLQPYSYWSGSAPSAMAFVPQLGFAQYYHHDFGVFFSAERFPKPSDWDFELAVEVDIYPSHQISPDNDKNRDRLVKYPVLRLHPDTNGPLKWFEKIMTHWANKFE